MFLGSRPVSWDLLTKSGVEDSRFHPGLAGSSFAVEKPNWTTELTSSAPQQPFEFFGFLLELLGAEFGQLPQVMHLPAYAGQLGKMHNLGQLAKLSPKKFEK